MISTVQFLILVALGVTGLANLAAQDTKAATPPPAQSLWTTKVFEVKYIDPDEIRQVYSGQSHVMDANRELKTLTVHGAPTFLKDVEDTIKRLDVLPAAPANLQITVYLLASATQAPTGTAVPVELKALTKELPGRLADLQMFRVRAGQAGETTSTVAETSQSVALARVRVESMSVNPGAKGEVVSLNGLRVWVTFPPVADAPTNATGPKTLKNEPDVAADIDVVPGEAVVVAKVGVEKPLAVVVRVGVVR